MQRGRAQQTAMPVNTRVSHSEAQKTLLACHFIVIIRGDTLDGVVGAGGEIENVSHAL